MAGPWPLPPHLQRLWFIHAMARDKALLNIGADVVIEGRFKPEELRDAFAAAVGRHDAFRLRFRLGKSGPECEALAEPVLRWRVVEGGFPDAYVGEVHARIAQAESEAFAIEEGSLVRGTLYVVAPGRAVLAVTAHHLAADARTIRLVVDDILREWRTRRGEAVPPYPHPGSVSDWLARGVLPGGPAAEVPCRRRAGLPLDRAVPPEQRSGKGDEVAVFLGGELDRCLRRACSAAEQTPFAGLLTAFFSFLRGLCGASSAEVGVLLTARGRGQRNIAGCFVQAVPMEAEVEGADAQGQALRDTGRRIRRLVGRVRRGQVPAAGRPAIMVSLVRDSSMELIAPMGIRVRYERRRRIQAECDLQVFFYEREEGIEVVFNYDSDVLDRDTVAAWAEGYLRLVERVCGAPGEPMEDASAIACRLQHVGLAVWELDIGLRRLASAGLFPAGEPREDIGQGVAMALAGSPEGPQWELVAPLREDAPCVGALQRDGEGPYHCCWCVSGVEAALVALRRAGVGYFVVRRGMKSDLFPGATLAFLVVDGFGLVEFMEGMSASAAAEGVVPNARAGTRLEVDTDDIAAARRFLRLMGHHPLPGAEPSPGAEVWLSSELSHEIVLHRVADGAPSRLSRVRHLLPGCAEVGEGLRMSTHWRSRCRFAAGAAQEAQAGGAP